MRQNFHACFASTAFVLSLVGAVQAQPAPRSPAAAPPPATGSATSAVPEAEAALKAMHGRLTDEIARKKYNGVEPYLPLWFTDELRARYETVRKRSKGNPQDGINFDIIFNAQDTQDAHIVRSIKSSRKSDTEALVVVATTWNQRRPPSEDRVFDYKVKKTAKGWRIDDIIYPPMEKGERRGTLRDALGFAQKIQRQSL